MGTPPTLSIAGGTRRQHSKRKKFMFQEKRLRSTWPTTCLLACQLEIRIFEKIRNPNISENQKSKYLRKSIWKSEYMSKSESRISQKIRNPNVSENRSGNLNI